MPVYIESIEVDNCLLKIKNRKYGISSSDANLQVFIDDDEIYNENIVLTNSLEEVVVNVSGRGLNGIYQIKAELVSNSNADDNITRRLFSCDLRCD